MCAKHDVGILAYGTLLGGFLSERWLGKPEPKDQSSLNWSLRKYLRFINAAGGWDAFQCVLKALSIIAQKHNVNIAAVATRYVLDIPVVSAVIVGSRLSPSSSQYIASNLAAFSFALDAEDRALISKVQKDLADIPGDNGDEYRRAPYLTATGDLSDHLAQTENDMKVAMAVVSNTRIEYSSGSKWEPIAVSLDHPVHFHSKGLLTSTGLLSCCPSGKHHPSVGHNSQFTNSVNPRHRRLQCTKSNCGDSGQHSKSN